MEPQKLDSAGSAPRLQIALLRASEIEECAELMAEAFEPNISYRAIFPHPDSRKAGLRLFFRSNLTLHLPTQTTYVARWEGKIAGTFTLEPPDAFHPGVIQMLRSGGLQLVFRFGFGVVRRMLKAKKVFAELEADAAPAPHTYLGLVAVAPAYQGRGIGREMMQEAVALLGAGNPCLLFTQEPRTVKFYEQFGWEIAIHRQMPVPDSRHAFPTWAMVRP